MSDLTSREELIKKIGEELERIVQTKRTLTIIVGIIAIQEGKLNDWITQFSEQMKPDRKANLEAATSKNIVALMKQLQNTPQ